MSTYYTVPTRPGIPRYTMRIPLGGTWYTLTFRWLPRLERWLLDVSDIDERPLVQGRIVVCGVDLMRGVGTGVLIASRARTPNSPPSLDWADVTLYWVEP